MAVTVPTHPRPALRIWWLRTPERTFAFLVERMRARFGRIDRLLFVPYALRDHDGYVEAMKGRGVSTPAIGWRASIAVLIQWPPSASRMAATGSGQRWMPSSR